MLNKKERLELYKKALEAYTRPRKWYFPVYQCFKNDFIDAGFCKFFMWNYDVKLVDLTELNGLKPKVMLGENGEYWFQKGELAPRIELLKKAIALAEQATD